MQPSASHSQHSNGSMMAFRHMRSPRDDAGQNAMMASLRSSVAPLWRFETRVLVGMMVGHSCLRTHRFPIMFLARGSMRASASHPLLNPNTWAAPKRWLACTKDRIWSNLPEEPARSRPSSHLNTLPSVEHFTKRRDVLSSVHHSRYIALRRGRIGQLAFLRPRGGGYQTNITPRSKTNRGWFLAPTCFCIWSAVCLVWVLRGARLQSPRGRRCRITRASIRAQERNGQTLSVQSSRLSQARNTDLVQETVGETSALSGPRARSAVGIST